jgi:hypothetical protein
LGVRGKPEPPASWAHARRRSSRPPPRFNVQTAPVATAPAAPRPPPEAESPDDERLPHLCAWLPGRCLGWLTRRLFYQKEKKRKRRPASTLPLRPCHPSGTRTHNPPPSLCRPANPPTRQPANPPFLPSSGRPRILSNCDGLSTETV